MQHLIRVHTVCHSSSSLQIHWQVIKWPCSNFRISRVRNSGVLILKVSTNISRVLLWVTLMEKTPSLGDEGTGFNSCSWVFHTNKICSDPSMNWRGHSVNEKWTVKWTVSSNHTSKHKFKFIRFSHCLISIFAVHWYVLQYSYSL